MADAQREDKFQGREIDIENDAGITHVVREDAFYVMRDREYAGFRPVRYHGGELISMRDIETPDDVAKIADKTGMSEREAATMVAEGNDTPKKAERARDRSKKGRA